MKTHLKMTMLRLSLLLCVAGATALTAHGQSTWSGAGTDQNWSTAGNWAGGAPGNNSTVTFPDGAFPITTNVQGVVNNIVQSSTTISSLTFNNQLLNFDTTSIPVGTALTVSGNLSLGANDAASINTVATITGGGSLFAGTNGTSTWTGQNGSGQGNSSVLDMSGLTNFTFNAGAASPGAINLGTGSSGSSITVNLAGGSNVLTASTLSIGNNNTRGIVVLNLGNGTNIINADTISMGISKTVGTMQFNNNAGGGVKIANHTGTGRATIVVSGEGSSGGTAANNNAFLLFNGGTADILASTMTIGNRTTRGGGGTATGVLSFDRGTVDVTTLNLALNGAGGGAVTGLVTVATSGVLKVGTGGLSLVNQAGTVGAGTLIITNGGTVICSNNISKTTSIGVGTITMSAATLNMASTAGTIGVLNGIPIDNFNITNSTLTLPAGSSANVSVVNFNPDATTQNTINVSSMPTINAFPSQFPLISYQVPSGNLNSFVLGTLPGLPGTFSGYISNNTTSLTIDLVVTNGPVAKADQWGGGINNLWDTTTLNWTNAGVAVNYNDLDLVTFNDLAHSSTVSLTGTRVPASLTVNNNVLNYTFNGAGKISGSVGLDKEGTASLTLAETGGDNFTGGILANAGTLILDNANGAISGGLTVGSGATLQIGNNDAAGSLPSGTLDNEGTIIFARSDNIQVGTVIPGGGAVTQNGSGRLALSGASTYSGVTTVNAGTLALTNAGAIASSSGVTVNSNATLDVSGVTTSASLASLALSNATLNVKVGYLQTNFTATTVTMAGSTNTINVRSLPPIASYPAIVTLLQSPSAISGFNLGLGSLPAGSPANAGTIALSGDQTSVLLTLTAGPIGVRPTVTWSGADALANINTNWSDAQNWQTPGVPASGEKVVFNDTAQSFGSPFDVTGDGPGGIVTPANIDNIVDINSTNAGLTYANTSFHNTQIKSGDALAVNGSLTVSGAAGTTTILGAGGVLTINNPANNSVLSVDNATAPTLDMSGLDTFTGTMSQIGIGFNSASSGSAVNGIWYLAKTNVITTGSGFSGIGAAIVLGGANNQNSAGTGTVYLGQTNVIFVDGITLGPGPSIGNLITFNPAFTNQNPGVFIRGITGNSSRVTLWSLGDATVNINNHSQGNSHVNDFSAGTLNALVSTLNVGQGSQGNTALANTLFTGTFNMGAGNLDVTSLKIGVSGGGAAGNGIGIMNVTGGTVVANTLNLAVTGGGQTNTSGALNLTNATLVASNGISIGAGTAGGTLSVIHSTVKVLNNGAIGSPASPLSTLNLDGATLQLNANGNGAFTNIVSTNIVAANVTTINIASVSNVVGTMQVPLISYVGTDPYPNLALGTFPIGYTIGNGGLLVDNVANLTIDVIINGTAAPTTNASILSVTLSGTNLILHGTNNNGGQTFRYAVLTSTNVATPLSNWTALVTNSFNADGTFDYTNAIVPSQPRGFFDIQVVP